MERGGSSLLYALLNKHPEVALMFEADLIFLRYLFLKPGVRDWPERWEFFNQVFRRHRMLAPSTNAKNSDLGSAFAFTHQSFARQKRARIWGDKSPHYYDCLNRMADEFPEARFIILWRSPKDTANAILRAAAGGSDYFSRRGTVLRQLLGYETLKKECDRLVRRNKPVCQISYENLVSDTPSIMRRVCKFLQIPYDDSLSQLKGADRSAIYEGQHHTFVRGDVIVQEPRPDHVSAELKAKIDGYVALWHRRYGSEWPPYPQGDALDVEPPGLLPRIRDGGLYRIFCAWDRITRVAFCFAPMPLLRSYRERKIRSLDSVKQTEPTRASARSDRGKIDQVVPSNSRASLESRP
jgi:hypothetical protein